jgi:XRE family transcriptional regulator, fatty acid utilization regulator
MRAYSGQKNNDLIAEVQISKYWETDNEYFCLSVAQAEAFGNKVPNSVTLGLLITSELQATFNFLKDPKIPYKIVNTTCERCSLPDCDNRVAPPTYIEKTRHQSFLEDELLTLEL